MAKVREEIEIAAAADRVWAAVHEDLEHAPRWSKNLAKAELVGGSRLGKGSRIRYQVKLPGGRREQIEVEQTTYTRPKRCAGRFVGGPLKGTWSYSYRESDGVTRLVYEMDFDMGGLLRFASGLLARQYADGIRQDLAELKTYLQSGKGGRR